MTPEQAIIVLKTIWRSKKESEVLSEKEIREALDMAIDALEQKACVKNGFKEMLLDINYAIEDGDGFQLDEWLEKLEEMFETHEEGTETHGCVSKESETHE